MRLPYGATQLLRQVKAMHPESIITPADKADGLGVWRQIAFDRDTSAWLYPALVACQDERVADLQWDDGRLLLTFVPDYRADLQGRFLIEEADRVLRGGE